jgi:cytochrome c biogenesis protein CcdA
MDPVAELTQRVAETGALGVLFGFLVGVALSLSPLSLPSVPVVISAVAPGRLDESGSRRLRPAVDAFPSVFAFIVGMDGVVAVAGFVFVEVTVALTRASVVMHLVAAAVLALVGLRLLTRRASLCNQMRPLPPHAGKAFVFGVAFSVGGCPACGPVAIGVGSGAALSGSPATALLVIWAFLLGRTFVLLGAAALAGRLLPTGANVSWRRFDVAVGFLFLAAAAYYLYRVATGQAVTTLPGEPGSDVLA